MLWTIAVILAVMWLLGMVSSYTLGGFLTCCCCSRSPSCSSMSSRDAAPSEGGVRRAVSYPRRGGAIVKVFEAMTPEVVTVPPEALSSTAARLMRESDIGPLPVCENEPYRRRADRPRHHGPRDRGRQDPNTTRVAEVMTPEVVCCLEGDDIERAAELMQSSQLRRLLVVDGEGRLAGIVSLGTSPSRPATTRSRARPWSGSPSRPRAR